MSSNLLHSSDPGPLTDQELVNLRLYVGGSAGPSVLERAADEIERLRAELAALDESVADWVRIAINSDGRRYEAGTRHAIQEYIAEDEAELRAEIARLKAQAARDAALVGLVLAEARAHRALDDSGCTDVSSELWQAWFRTADALDAAIKARIEQEDQSGE